MQTAAPIELAPISSLDRLFLILLARLVISYKFFLQSTFLVSPARKSSFLPSMLERVLDPEVTIRIVIRADILAIAIERARVN